MKKREKERQTEEKRRLQEGRGVEKTNGPDGFGLTLGFFLC